MSPRPIGTTVAERYDLALRYARGPRLPPDVPRPLPTRFWPQENIELLERYQAWLLAGGASANCTRYLYLPIAGHVLGMNCKPHPEIDLEGDLERVYEYMLAKGSRKGWLMNCRNSLAKFRRFLRQERGLGDVRKAKDFDVAQHTQGLPAWLVSELERFQRVQQVSWRSARLEQNIHRFWSTHLRVWRFLCGEKKVQQLSDLVRQHLLDYLDWRLGAGYSVATVNVELLTLRSFLVFLQDEGYPIPHNLLHLPALKQPDPLPKFLTDEQVRLLRDHFEERVAEAGSAHFRRDALLDRAIFYLLWQCGLRTCEVGDLRLEDLDLAGSRITIRDSKGRKDRTVYVTETASLALLRGAGFGDHVFLYRNAPVLGPLVHCRIRAAGARVGVKVHPHRLRHTCATQLLNAGCRITSIQRFLGHKKLNTTMIYARAHDQTIAQDYFRAMEQVEQQLAMPISIQGKPPSPGEMLSLASLLFKSVLAPEQQVIITELMAGLSRWLGEGALRKKYNFYSDDP
jgi:integrase/recombinase XerC